MEISNIIGFFFLKGKLVKEPQRFGRFDTEMNCGFELTLP